jgi:diacylglycerol kinase (ATP)
MLVYTTCNVFWRKWVADKILIMEKKFSLQDRLKSFTYSWAGLKAVLHTEHNTWIHLMLTVLVIPLGFALQISKMEFCALVIVMAMVWMAELFNTCIEKAMDFISTDMHPQIEVIKDMAAAAVLIAAVAAVIVGSVIFIPKLF